MQLEINIGFIFDETQPFARSSTFDKLPVFEDFYLIIMKVSKHLKMIFVPAFVKCRLDTCHYYTQDNLIQKLQIVQNCAARLIMKGRKYDHITPVLQEPFTGFALTNALCLKFCFSPI